MTIVRVGSVTPGDVRSEDLSRGSHDYIGGNTLHYFQTLRAAQSLGAVHRFNPSGFQTGLAVMGIVRRDWDQHSYDLYLEHDPNEFVPDSAYSRIRASDPVQRVWDRKTRTYKHVISCLITHREAKRLRRRLVYLPWVRIHADAASGTLKYDGLEVVLEPPGWDGVIVDMSDGDLEDPDYQIHAVRPRIPPVFSQFETDSEGNTTRTHQSTYEPPSHRHAEVAFEELSASVSPA